MRGTCLATCLLLALPACGAGEAEPLVDAERQEVIDVAAGTYRAFLSRDGAPRKPVAGAILGTTKGGRP